MITFPLGNKATGVVFNKQLMPHIFNISKTVDRVSFSEELTASIVTFSRYEQGINNDCGYNQTDTWIIRDSVVVGKGTSESGTFYEGFLRFPNIALAQGTVVIGAYLYLSPGGGSSYPTYMDIVVEEADNPANIATIGDYLGRSWSTSKINFDIESSPVGEVISPDITTLVQAILNRPGWVSGNAISFAIVPAADAIYSKFISFYGWHSDPFYATEPKLVIGYSS